MLEFPRRVVQKPGSTIVSPNAPREGVESLSVPRV